MAALRALIDHIYRGLHAASEHSSQQTVIPRISPIVADGLEPVSQEIVPPVAGASRDEAIYLATALPPFPTMPRPIAVFAAKHMMKHAYLFGGISGGVGA